MVVKTVVEAQDILTKPGRLQRWRLERKSKRFASFKLTIHLMMEMKASSWSNWTFSSHQEDCWRNKAHYEETRFPYDNRPTSIADIAAGYIDKENEVIFGIQNDELFKLNFMPSWWYPSGGNYFKRKWIRTRSSSSWNLHKIRYNCKRWYLPCYTSNIRRARHAHTVTGLSRCILSWTYHQFVHVWLLLRCWLLDGWKANDWNSITGNRWRINPSSWRSKPSIRTFQ